jgi:hypothetical protein
LKKICGMNAVPAAALRKKQKHSQGPAVLNLSYEQLPGRKAVRLAAAKTGSLPAPRERWRCTRNTQTPKPPTLPPGTATAFSWPNLSLRLLASRLNFHTCMGKRPLLIGGEDLHLFPVVSELGTTVETHHVRSRLHGSLTAALSWLAGLGKADPFVPASEQSVKDIHNLLPAAFALAEQPQIPGPAKVFIPLGLIPSLL